KVPLTVFEQRSHGFTGFFLGIEVRDAVTVDSQQTMGVGPGPDVSVAIALERENLKRIRRCRSDANEAAAVPSHDAVIGAGPQISVAGYETVDLGIGQALGDGSGLVRLLPKQARATRSRPDAAIHRLRDRKHR